MSIKSISPFLGMNVNLPVTQLEHMENGKAAGSYMRALDNVDVTDKGTLRTRRGWLKKLGGVNTRCLFSLHDGSALVADYTKLYRLQYDGQNMTRTEILSGINAGAHISYAAAPDGYVYLSDGFSLWRYRDGVATKAAPSAPNFIPSVSVGAGALPPGLYTVIATHQAADGRESGASLPMQVSVGKDGGSLSITTPTPPSDAVTTCIYMTSANGDVPYYIGSGGSVTVSAAPLQQGQCQTRDLRPMPGGRFVRYHKAVGRLLVAIGGTLYASQPFNPGLYHPVDGYFLFPEDITLLEATPVGVYVVTGSKTYFMEGDFEGVREVAAFGAAIDSAGRTHDGAIYWFGRERGIIKAGDDGTLSEQQSIAVPVDTTEAAALFVRQRDGLEQVIVSTDGGNEASASMAHSFMDAQIIKQGVTND